MNVPAASKPYAPYDGGYLQPFRIKCLYISVGAEIPNHSIGIFIFIHDDVIL